MSEITRSSQPWSVWIALNWPSKFDFIMLFIGINNEVQNMQHIQIKFNQVHRFKFCTKIHMTEVIIEGGGGKVNYGEWGTEYTYWYIVVFIILDWAFHRQVTWEKGMKISIYQYTKLKWGVRLMRYMKSYQLL